MTNRLAIASAMYAMPALDLGIDHSSITAMYTIVNKWMRAVIPRNTNMNSDHPRGFSGFSSSRPQILLREPPPSDVSN